MALTKSVLNSTQRTTTGQTTAVDVHSSYNQTLDIKHVNGTGTITAGATVVVQVQPYGSLFWSNLITYRFGTTASATETRVCPLPDDAGYVRMDYAVPTGSTGHTLDADVGTVTALI